MTDEIEEGPDPNDVRRHAKKMCTETEYRKRYRRIDYYRPSAKQLEFHNLIAPERCLRGANQSGKTTAGGAQMTMDVLGRYPDWYKGRRFDKPPPIGRTFDFLGWVASTTSTTTRDGAQVKLLGDVREDGGLGTGLIPLDSIVSRPIMARGISDFVDTVTIRRDSGGLHHRSDQDAAGPADHARRSHSKASLLRCPGGLAPRRRNDGFREHRHLCGHI
jgi:hypothetical protein